MSITDSLFLNPLMHKGERYLCLLYRIHFVALCHTLRVLKKLLQVLKIFFLSFFLSFFLVLTFVHLFIVDVQGYNCTPSHSVTNTHTRWNSPGRGIGLSQRRLTTHNSHKIHPCPRQTSNPRSKPASSRKPMP